MEAVEVVAVAIAVLGALLIALIIRRRILLRGAGAVDMSLRLRVGKTGGGWALGIGRYTGNELEWFRAFSYSLRPSRSLDRSGLAVMSRRTPEGAESWAVQASAVVLECKSDGAPVQLALTTEAIPGFLSWLEAAPGYPPSPGRRPRR